MPFVTDRIIQLWNLPPERGNPREFRRDTTVRPTEVWEALRRDFDVDVIRGSLVAELSSEAELEWGMGIPDQRRMFLSGAALELMTAVPELALDRHTVAELVYKLSSVGWLNHFGYWVGARLDAADLLDSLRVGIASARFEECRCLCFEGIGLYYRYVELPTTHERIHWSLEQLEIEVRRYYRSKDPQVIRAAMNARARIWEIRRREGLPKVRAEAFAAYRVENGSAVEHVIERIADGEQSIKIVRLGVRSNTLFVEFENHDPAVLPEDVPGIIEDTLLRRLGLGLFDSDAQQVAYVNLETGTTTTLPIA